MGFSVHDSSGGPPEPLSNPWLVLIIDDSSTARLLTQKALMSRGFRTLVLEDAFGAGAMILREKPNAVLLDVDMPGLSGPELLRLIRQRPSTKCCRVIFHSDQATEKLAALSKQYGADGWIRKGDYTNLPSALIEIMGCAWCPDVSCRPSPNPRAADSAT